MSGGGLNRSLLLQIMLVILGAAGLGLATHALAQPLMGHGWGSLAGALAAALAVAVALQRMIVVRIRRLTRGLAEVAEGDLERRLTSRWDDEIGALTRNIDELVGTLRRNYEELRTHDELRRRMVANVSHELRTPLTSIIGYLETEIAADGGERRNLEVCHREARRLSRLVQDLFQLSKLDTHQLEFHFETMSLVELADSVGLAFEQRFADKRIAFGTELPDDPLLVVGDGNRLGQVITNLLGNAAVFTPQGGRVVLRCRRQGQRAVCEVQDTGIGISRRDLPHIFESFFHLEKSRTRNLGGTGLGLAICKAIVDAHEGSIEAESREGEGTVFRFELDLAPDLDEADIG